MWLRLLLCGLLAVGWLVVCFGILIRTGSEAIAAAALVTGYAGIFFWFSARVMTSIALSHQPRARERGVIFRRGASNKEKAFTLFVYFWIALSFYGGLSNFAPEEAWLWLATCIAIPVSLFFFLPMLLDRHPGNLVPTYRKSKRRAYYVGQFVMCYGLAWCGLAFGLASVATRLGGEEFAGEYRVSWKSSGARQRRECYHRVKVTRLDLDSGSETELCLRESLWAAIGIGDVLQATGRSSMFGTTFVHVRRDGAD